MKSVLALFIIVTFLSSCKQKENVETNINKYANAVLAASQETSQLAIREYMISIRLKMMKAETRDTAIVYQPKADSAIALGNKVINYLDTLMDRVNSGGEIEEKDSLYEKLKTFETEIWKIDTRANELFSNKILDLDTLTSFKSKNNQQFNHQYLKNLSKNQTTLFLNYLKIDILNIEVKMLHYFDMSCGVVGNYYDTYNAIISQNSDHFKQGRMLEISAGIGQFCSKPNAKVTIDKKEISINASPDNVVIYKMKVSKENGKHTIPVKISWIKPNGETSVLSKNVIYYVE
jgi:hypothetical protein